MLTIQYKCILNILLLRQMESNLSLEPGHLCNMGRLIEEMESKLRNGLDQVLRFINQVCRCVKCCFDSIRISNDYFRKICFLIAVRKILNPRLESTAVLKTMVFLSSLTNLHKHSHLQQRLSLGATIRDGL